MEGQPLYEKSRDEKEKRHNTISKIAIDIDNQLILVGNVINDFC